MSGCVQRSTTTLLIFFGKRTTHKFKYIRLEIHFQTWIVIFVLIFKVYTNLDRSYSISYRPNSFSFILCIYILVNMYSVSIGNPTTCFINESEKHACYLRTHSIAHRNCIRCSIRSSHMVTTWGRIELWIGLQLLLLSIHSMVKKSSENINVPVCAHFVISWHFLEVNKVIHYKDI